MIDKEKEIVAIIANAFKAGYTITFERNDIGALRHGIHQHIGFVDELLEETGGVDPFAYINAAIAKKESK